MILVFSSITYALKARDLLSRASIDSEIIRSPRVREIRGCGYGLKLDDRDSQSATNICAASGIKILKTLDDITQKRGAK